MDKMKKMEHYLEVSREIFIENASLNILMETFQTAP